MDSALKKGTLGVENIFSHVLAAEEAGAMFMSSSWLDLKLLQLPKGRVNSSCCALWCPVCQSALLKMIVKACNRSATWLHGDCTDSLLTGTVFALARQFFLLFSQPTPGFHTAVAAQLAHRRVSGRAGCHSYIHTSPAIQTRHSPAPHRRGKL